MYCSHVLPCSCAAKIIYITALSICSSENIHLCEYHKPVIMTSFELRVYLMIQTCVFRPRPTKSDWVTMCILAAQTRWGNAGYRPERFTFPLRGQNQSDTCLNSHTNSVTADRNSSTLSGGSLLLPLCFMAQRHGVQHLTKSITHGWPGGRDLHCLKKEGGNSELPVGCKVSQSSN